MQRAGERGSLVPLTLAVFVALSGWGCALNQRLVIARAPYGVSDLVFAADRQLEIKPCDDGHERHVWAQMSLMFVAGRPITALAYRLEQQEAEAGEFREVAFPYELRVLTKPEEADQKLTESWRGAPTLSPPVQQEMQQQMVKRATDAKRVVRNRDEWRCDVESGDHVLTYEGNRLLGKHTVALIARAGGFHTGGHYRLTFALPFVASPLPPPSPPPPAAAPLGSPAAPSPASPTPPSPAARDEMSRLAAGERPPPLPVPPAVPVPPSVGGGSAPEDIIGRIELTMIKNSNLIGVPVGLGLIIGFLVLTTL